LLAVAFALLRELSAARVKPSLLMEVAALPAVPDADLRVLVEPWRV
jgi:hypothetical protein